MNKEIERFFVEQLELAGFEVSLIGAILCRKHWIKHQDMCAQCEFESAG